MEEAKKKFFKEESNIKEEAVALSDNINPAKDVHQRRTIDGRSPNR